MVASINYSPVIDAASLFKRSAVQRKNFSCCSDQGFGLRWKQLLVVQLQRQYGSVNREIAILYCYILFSMKI